MMNNSIDSKNLTRRSFSAAFWNSTLNILKMIVQFGVGIFLARMLSPSEFGVMGMITIFWFISGLLMQGGFCSALIQKKEVSSITFSSFFYYSIVIAVFCYLMLLLFSPLIAVFFKQPVLQEIIPVIGLTIPLSALATVPGVILQKQLKQRTIALSQFISLLLSSILALFLAYKGAGVWSLVYRQLSACMMSTLLITSSVRWFPRLEFKFSALKNMVNFSFKILACDLLDILSNNIYNLIIGRCFAAADLGFFERGRSYGALLSGSVTRPAGAVIFPVMSLIQDEPKRLRNALRHSLIIIISTIIMPSVLLFVLAQPLFAFLLTERWLQSVPYFRVFLIVATFYPFVSINRQLLLAHGYPGRVIFISVINKILIIVNILVTFKFGIMYMMYGHLVVSLIAIYTSGYYAGGLINYSIFSQLKSIFIYVFIAGIIGVLVHYIWQSLLTCNLFLQLIIPGITGMLMYFIFNYGLKTEACLFLLKMFAEKKAGFYARLASFFNRK